MEKTPPSILIRTAQPADEPDLIEICHRTGNTRVDPYLFGLRWCLDYLWHDTDNCFVAVDQGNGQVVGYILGTLDSYVQVQRFKTLMVPKIKQYWKRMRSKTVFDFFFYLMIRYVNQDVLKSLFSEYPAHLHINLAPEYQRRGIGSQLLSAYEDNLRKNNVPGYHLGVGADNQVGIGFYRKMGLDQLQSVPKIGKPLAIAFGRRLA
jgi:ribosomal protein S18 acetylase RimI-like enzyme